MEPRLKLWCKQPHATAVNWRV